MRTEPSLPVLVGRVEPGSPLIDCDQADQRITVDVSTHLNPACVYTQSFGVTASNVVLACRGAVVESCPSSLQRAEIFSGHAAALRKAAGMISGGKLTQPAQSDAATA